ncbi:MAG: hypothetical protein EXR76_18975 [Myxococcales bacterium]|nr:hypothetical protein [Myxococcales bacterium]
MVKMLVEVARPLAVLALAAFLVSCVKAQDDSGGADASGNVRDMQNRPLKDAGPEVDGSMPAGDGGEDAAAETREVGAADLSGHPTDGLADDLRLDAGADALAPDVAPTGICGGHELIDLRASLVEGHVDDTTDGASATLAASCGGQAGGERVYFYDVAGPLDALVFSTDHPETLAPTVIYVRTDCDALADLACNRGSGAQPGTAVRLGPLGVGRLYIVVDQGSRNGGGAYRLSVVEEAASACRNLIDDDFDAATDLDDPGCESPNDDTEQDPNSPPECSDRVDNDGDMATDYPADPECTAAGVDREAPSCHLPVGLIDVGEGGGDFMVNMTTAEPSLIEPTCIGATLTERVFQLRVSRPVHLQVQASTALFGQGGPFVLYLREVCDRAPDLACVGGQFTGLLDMPQVQRGIYYIVVDLTADAAQFGANIDTSVTIRVTPLLPACADTLDNDEDGEVDALDLGCESPDDDIESDDPVLRPFCGDNVDNDADGAIDFPLDDGCTGIGDACEEDAFMRCGPVCLDTRIDAMNCGACGNVCDPGVECIGSYCGGAVAVFPMDSFGHHGGCDVWNQCVDGQGCADAACRIEGFGHAVAFDVGSCVNLPNQGIRCNLFFNLAADLNFDADYHGCELPVAYNIRCLP